MSQSESLQKNIMSGVQQPVRILSPIPSPPPYFFLSKRLLAKNKSEKEWGDKTARRYSGAQKEIRTLTAHATQPYSAGLYIRGASPQNFRTPQTFPEIFPKSSAKFPKPNDFFETFGRFRESSI